MADNFYVVHHIFNESLSESLIQQLVQQPNESKGSIASGTNELLKEPFIHSNHLQKLVNMNIYQAKLKYMFKKINRFHEEHAKK